MPGIPPFLFLPASIAHVLVAASGSLVAAVAAKLKPPGSSWRGLREGGGRKESMTI